MQRSNRNYFFWLSLTLIPIGLLVITSLHSNANSMFTVERVSIASGGIEANNISWRPHISGDGRYIAFHSLASNLVDNDTNDNTDIFIYDWQTKQTTRVSVASDGTQADEQAGSPFVSADGRYVVFESWATNLVDNDTNGYSDIFIHDRTTGETTLLSLAYDSTQSNYHVRNPSISADGRYVAFESHANNLVLGDINTCLPFVTVGFCQDVFIHDRTSDQTSLASVSSDGTQANEASQSAIISTDGIYVAFMSRATNLVADDTNNIADIFVFNQQTGQTAIVSVASDGTQANSSPGGFDISADGRYVVFSSYANNLIDDDTNGVPDIFVRDRQTSQTFRVSVASDGTEGNGYSFTPAISGDGRYIVFGSRATNLVDDDTNGAPDIFVRDRQSGETRLISLASDGTQANASSGESAISWDGRRIVFQSAADNLIYNDTNMATDVFVYEQIDTPTVTATSANLEGGKQIYLPLITKQP